MLRPIQKRRSQTRGLYPRVGSRQVHFQRFAVNDIDFIGLCSLIARLSFGLLAVFRDSNFQADYSSAVDTSSLAAERTLWVAPCRPQPHGNGKNIICQFPSSKGFLLFGISIKLPKPLYTAARVAKIRAAHAKIGCPCASLLPPLQLSANAGGNSFVIHSSGPWDATAQTLISSIGSMRRHQPAYSF